MSVNAKLVVVGGDVKTAEIKLRLPSTVGRGRGTTIMLPHPLVSRQHCELFEKSGQLMVRDLGSLNGTFINNERITEAPLSSGELLTIGTVTFRAVFEDAPENGAPVVGPTKTTRPRDTDPNEIGATLNVPGPARAPANEPVELSEVEDLGDDLEFEPADANKTDTLDEVDDIAGELIEDAPAAAPPQPAPVLAKPAPLATPAAPMATPAAQTAKPAAPVAKPASPSFAAPPATPPPATAKDADDEDDSDAADEEDDLNDFLKSLGNK